MSLTVTTSSNQYQFDGPHRSSTLLRPRSGVYVVSTVTPKGWHKVLDVGESHDINGRLADHDRAGQWARHVIDGLHFSALYCDERSRMLIESELRAHFAPPCGNR